MDCIWIACIYNIYYIYIYIILYIYIIYIYIHEAMAAIHAAT